MVLSNVVKNHHHGIFVSDVKKLAAAIVKQWMSLVRNQSGISGINLRDQHFEVHGLFTAPYKVLQIATPCQC